MKSLIVSVILFSLFACKPESVNFHAKYVAKFDNSKIDKVDSVFLSVGTINKLRVFKKDRKEMQYLSRGKDAFFSALYYENSPVFVLTNVGATDALVFTATDFGKMSNVDLERITQQILESTSSAVDLRWENQL
jgi:hypothetical protein